MKHNYMMQNEVFRKCIMWLSGILAALALILIFPLTANAAPKGYSGSNEISINSGQTAIQRVYSNGQIVYMRTRKLTILYDSNKSITYDVEYGSNIAEAATSKLSETINTSSYAPVNSNAGSGAWQLAGISSNNAANLSSLYSSQQLTNDTTVYAVWKKGITANFSSTNHRKGTIASWGSFTNNNVVRSVYYDENPDSGVAYATAYYNNGNVTNGVVTLPTLSGRYHALSSITGTNGGSYGAGAQVALINNTNFTANWTQLFVSGTFNCNKNFNRANDLAYNSGYSTIYGTQTISVSGTAYNYAFAEVYIASLPDDSWTSQMNTHRTPAVWKGYSTSISCAKSGVSGQHVMVCICFYDAHGTMQPYNGDCPANVTVTVSAPSDY